MKILMVSINSIHFERWTNQLQESGHEVHWFNVRDGGFSKKLSWVNQIVGWKFKFINNKARVFIKKRWPWLYNKLSFLIENSTEKAFEKALLEIQPDVVHSFVLYISCVPILPVMQKYPNIKWMYSSWGSDLFYFQNQPKYLNDIKQVLPRVNYMFADCKRDIDLAKAYGFDGQVLGVYPGGGGYPIDDYKAHISSLNQRKLILVKGYQGRSGRAIAVLKALESISVKLNTHPVLVFGADNEVEDYIIKSDLNSKLDLTVYPKSEFLPHMEIIKLMGQALIYIGNSNSDGMPNTLLESIIMGAFPIQSNPGGATAELIEHGKNGFLIEDCNNSIEIETLIDNALNNMELIQSVCKYNQKTIMPSLDRTTISKEVIAKYNSIIN
ncbi:glycosyltransferase [Algibacter luteus]|uniref:glycosyltransferase n=1 Tax=Algibacter luteus TaxID=1178825 RepID=UPI0025963504|nr:glycosyltransferase [Algibacter luteus]WJJ95986.1 glycosyltransferase [Algibacter luteus]